MASSGGQENLKSNGMKDSNIENWNPMEEDYENSKFNRYNEGVGRDLTSSKNISEGVKLFVGGVSLDLGQEGFYNLFAEYGHVLDHKLLPPKDSTTKRCIGFITMKNAVEAEQAIRKLDGKAIGSFTLKVSPAISREEKDRRRRVQEMENEFNASRNFQRQDVPAPFQQRNVGGDWQQYPRPMDGHGHHPRSSMGLLGALPTPPRHLMMNRNQFNHAPIGRGMPFMSPRPPWFSNGPGMQRADQPFGVPNTGIGRGQPFQPGPKSDHVQKRKQCLNCNKLDSSYRCAQCKMFYCSTECQKQDWPRHQSICQSAQEYLNENLPSYAKVGKKTLTDDSASQASSPNKSKLGNNKGKTDHNKKSDGYETDRKENNFGKSNNVESKVPKQVRSNATKSPKKYEERGLSSSVKESLNEENGFSSIKDKPQNEQDSMLTPEAGDCSSCLVQMTIPNASEGECILVHYESPDKFWIALSEFLEQASEFGMLVNEALNDPSIEPPEKIKVGDYVGFLHAGDWNRARVVSIKDKKVSIFAVDIGFQETIELEKLKPLGDDMLQFPAQILCCCLKGLRPKGTVSWSEAANTFIKDWFGVPMTKFITFSNSLKIGDKFALSISHEGESLNNLLVKKDFAEWAKDEPQHKLKEKTEKEKTENRRLVRDMKSPADDLEINVEIQCVLIAVDSLQKIWVQPVQSAEALASVTEKISTVDADSLPYNPIKGELIAARFSEDLNWYRAEVLEEASGSFSVVFIDYGNKETCTIENIRKIKDQFLLETPGIAICCSLQGVKESPSDSFEKEIKSILSKSINGLMSMILKSKKDLSIDVKVDEESLSEKYSKMVSSYTSTSVNQKTPLANPQPVISSSNHQTKSFPNCPSGPVVQSGDNQKPFGKSHDTKTRTSVENVKPTLDFETLPKIGQTKVLVTHFENFGELYVRLNEFEKDYYKMMTTLNRITASKSALKKVFPGMFVSALYSFDDNWYRGRVEKVNGDKAKVLFIDFGNTEVVQCQHIRPLAHTMYSLKGQAIKISMTEIPDCPEKTFRDFKSWIENNTILVEPNNSLWNLYKLDGTDIVELVRSNAESQKTQCKKAVVGKQSIQEKTNNKLPQVQDKRKKIPYINMKKSETLSAVCVGVTSPMDFTIQVAGFLEEAAKVTIALKDRILADARPVTKVEIGDCVASKFSEDNDIVWYRCRVTSVDGDKCVVFFVDYGNSEEVKIADLMQLSDEDCGTPACTVSCCIKECTQETMNEENTLQIAEMTQVFVHEQDTASGMCTVDVLDNEGTCMNNKFIKTQKLSALSKLSPKKSSQPEVTSPKLPVKPSIEYESLSVGEGPATVMVWLVVSPHEIYLSPLTSMQEYSTIVAPLLEERASSLPALSHPKVGSQCVAFSKDGNWYRAQIEVLSSADSCQVKFIDFGNSEEVPISTLKELTTQFTSIKAQAIRCCLQGYETSTATDKDTCKKLKEALENQCFQVQALEKRNGIFFINIEDQEGNPIKIDPILQTDATIEDIVYEVPSDGEIYVSLCFIYNLSDFYCTKASDMAAVEQLSELLEDDVAKGKLATCQNPKVGGVYACQFKGVWYRCQVCEIGDKEVTVKYLDYGNTEKTSSELKSIRKEHLQLPVRLIWCKLHNILPGQNMTWDSIEFTQYLSMMLGDPTRQYIVTIEGKEAVGAFKVNLQAETNGQKIDIAADLVSVGMATFEPVKPSIEYESLSVGGEAVTVMVWSVVSPHEIYLSPLTIVQEYATTVAPLLEEMASSLPALSHPKVGSLCVASFSKDGNWYRAQIEVLSSSDSCQVKFIDYGNSEEVPTSKLKELTSEFTSIKAQAIQCCLQGFETSIATDKDTCKKLKETLENQCFQVQAIEKRNGIFVINIDDQEGNPIKIDVTNTKAGEDVNSEEDDMEEIRRQIQELEKKLMMKQKGFAT